ncbi:MAG: hypothetical protein G01um101456_217 [Parcubacteria group bacterium Gr01-1014_56]|nr:MAG: hypothetical protein G01um101456_217 [Parcubacteria group bacterium Gr01-1014_56]
MDNQDNSHSFSPLFVVVLILLGLLVVVVGTIGEVSGWLQFLKLFES